MIDQALRSIVRHYHKNKQVPPMNQLAKELGISSEETQKIVESLVKKNYLLRINGKLYLNKNKVVGNQQQGRESAQAAPQNQEKPPVNLPALSPVLLIRVVMFVVAIGAIYMSVYYSYEWLTEFLTPFKATVLAVIMVAYLALSVQVAGILFHSKRASHKAYGTVVVLTAAIVFAFSIISTVAGQYNSTVKIEEETANVQSSTINEQLSGVTDRIESKKREVDALQNLLEEFDTLEKRTENWRYYITTRNDLERMNSELEALRSEKNELLDRKNDLVQTEGAQAVQAGSFYQFLSNLFGLSVWVVRFILSIAPALFIDVVGPVALSVSLFLKEKE